LQPSQEEAFLIQPGQAIGLKEIVKLKDDSSRLFTLGTFIYRDIYGDEHYVRFCTSHSFAVLNEAMSKPDSPIESEACNGYNDGD